MHIAGFERVDSEPGGPDQIIHLAVEMAAATDPFPARRQPALPPDDPRLRRKAMLHEQQPPSRLGAIGLYPPEKPVAARPDNGIISPYMAADRKR
jgi:hypothetical protein